MQGRNRPRRVHPNVILPHFLTFVKQESASGRSGSFFYLRNHICNSILKELEITDRKPCGFNALYTLKVFPGKYLDKYTKNSDNLIFIDKKY